MSTVSTKSNTQAFRNRVIVLAWFRRSASTAVLNGFGR